MGQSPEFNGEEKSIVYNPRNMKYYFIRQSSLKEFDPRTKITKTVSEDPVSVVTVDPNGKLFYGTDTRVVFYDPVTMKTKTVMTHEEPVDSLELNFETKVAVSTDKDSVTVKDDTDDDESEDSDTTRKGYVYYTAGNQVIKVNRDDPTDKEIIEVSGASNYVVDPKNNILFYTMFGQNIVREAPVGGERVFIVRGAGKISALKLDQKERILYFTDSYSGELKSYNLKTGSLTVVYSGLRNPEKINVNPTNG